MDIVLITLHVPFLYLSEQYTSAGTPEKDHSWIRIWATATTAISTLYYTRESLSQAWF